MNSLSVETEILIRKERIEGPWSYIWNQIKTVNLANAGFLITMIILSANVQSSLNRQEQSNSEARLLIVQSNTQNSILQNSLQSAATQIVSLNSVAQSILVLYSNVIQTGSLYNLNIMGEIQNKFSNMTNVINNLSSDVTVLNTLSNQNLIGTGHLNIGRLKIFSGTRVSRNTGTYSYGTIFTITNLNMLSDPYLFIENQGSSNLPEGSWSSAYGISCAVGSICNMGFNIFITSNPTCNQAIYVNRYMNGIPQTVFVSWGLSGFGNFLSDSFAMGSEDIAQYAIKGISDTCTIFLSIGYSISVFSI